MDVYVPNFTLSRAGKSVISRGTWVHGSADGGVSDVLHESLQTQPRMQQPGEGQEEYLQNSTVRRHLKQWKAYVGWFSRWGRTLLAIFKHPEFGLRPEVLPCIQARHIWRSTVSMMWVELRLSQQEAIDLLDTYFLLWGDRGNGERCCPTALSKRAYINSNNPSITGHFSSCLLPGMQIHWLREQQGKF